MTSTTPTNVASVQSLLSNMFKHQHEINKVFVNDEYFKTNICLEDAVIAEAGELLESAGYKWWKNSVIDLDNIKTEIVDIWHFLMTRSLIIELRQVVSHNEKLTDEILDEVIFKLTQFNLVGFNSANIKAEELLNMLPEPNIPSIKFNTKLLIKRMLNNEMDSVINLALVELILSSQMNFLEFTKRYMIKNVLNKLRQDLGDKTGEYSRHWVVPELRCTETGEDQRMEDNAIAVNLILNSDLVNFDDIYDSLKDYYLEHTMKQAITDEGTAVC